MRRSLEICFLALLVCGLASCDKLNILREKITGSTSKPNPVAAAPQGAATPTPQAPVVAGTAAQPANVLVSIGTWTMTKEDFQEKLKALKEAVPEYNINDKAQNRQVLDRLVEQRLFVQEAERQRLDDNKDLKMAVEEFRNTLLVQQLAAKVTEGIEATDAEAKDFYDKNTALFVKEGEWKVREIVVADEGAAKQIATEISQGADFAQTAQQKSKGKTAAQGGDLGPLKNFEFPAMANAVLSLNIGSVSAPVQGPEGYYIFKLEEKKGGEPLSFDDVKKDLKAELTFSKKEQVIVNYLNALKEKATIQINEKLLEE